MSVADLQVWSSLQRHTNQRSHECISLDPALCCERVLLSAIYKRHCPSCQTHAQSAHARGHSEDAVDHWPAVEGMHENGDALRINRLIRRDWWCVVGHCG